jgi:uncharacterized membrane protein
MPGLADATPTYIVTGVIFLIMLGFTLYARRMTVAGVLR